jgi:hypothetical protein
VAFVEECTVMTQLIILQFRSSLYGIPDQSTFSSLSRVGLPVEWSDKNLHKRFGAPKCLPNLKRETKRYWQCFVLLCFDFVFFAFETCFLCVKILLCGTTTLN